MDKTHALIIDDDEKIIKLLTQFLEKHAVQVSQALNTEAANEIISNDEPDIILVDLMMPGEDGITFCRRIRESFKKPIIMLSAVDDDIEQIVAHEVGVDDYLTKPYNMRILLAKMKSALRRYKSSSELEEIIVVDDMKNLLTYHFADWQLNTNNRILSNTDEDSITLSSGEYDLLLTLLEHPKRVLTRDQLLEYTQGNATDVFDRSIDVLISRLRKKLENPSVHKKFIKTIRNGGYMFDSTVTKQKSS